MATPEQRDELRRKTGEVDSTTYSDLALDQYIADAGDDIDLAASKIWREKASEYAELVDVSEAGSSRKNSVLFKNATEQAEFYEQSSGADTDVPAAGTYSTTRPIVRL